mgnify:CR=1 FL=1
MRLIYSQEAKEQLKNIKEYISKDNKDVARQYLLKIKSKLEILEDYPYIGKVNATFNIENIREFVVFGHKIIYKINQNSIYVMAIYKYIDFDETKVDV